MAKGFQKIGAPSWHYGYTRVRGNLLGAAVRIPKRLGSSSGFRVLGFRFLGLGFSVFKVLY